MSLVEFEMGDTTNKNKRPSEKEMEQAVFFAGALPWYKYAFWCVGYFGEPAIKHFDWGKCVAANAIHFMLRNCSFQC